MAADKRRAFIISTAHDYFGVSVPDDELENDESRLLDKFLDQPKCRTLCAVPLTSSGYPEYRVKLTSELSNGGNTLVFFKVSNEGCLVRGNR